MSDQDKKPDQVAMMKLLDSQFSMVHDPAPHFKTREDERLSIDHRNLILACGELLGHCMFTQTLGNGESYATIVAASKTAVDRALRRAQGEIVI